MCMRTWVCEGVGVCGRCVWEVCVRACVYMGGVCVCMMAWVYMGGVCEGVGCMWGVYVGGLRV